MAQGLTTYILWGFTALYWPLIKQAGALELLANRVIWSLVLVVIMLVVLRLPWTWLKSLRFIWPRLLAASVFIALNWLTYIWAVTAGPLWLFAIAAPRIPLGTLGMMQFISPTIQLMTGLFILHQQVPPLYFLGLGLVWVGLGFYLTGSLRNTRRLAMVAGEDI